MGALRMQPPPRTTVGGAVHVRPIGRSARRAVLLQRRALVVREGRARAEHIQRLARLQAGQALSDAARWGCPD